MLYYCEYSNGRRYVRAYDEEKHGAPRIAGKSAFLYHGDVITNADNIFTTESAALASWGAMAGRVLNRRKCHYKAADALVMVEGIRI